MKKKLEKKLPLGANPTGGGGTMGATMPLVGGILPAPPWGSGGGLWNTFVR